MSFAPSQLAPSHAVELLLGLPRDYLRQQGDWSVQFNPAWPGQAATGAAVWNVAVAVLCLELVVYVYTRDGRSRGVRVVLGLLRAGLLALVLVLLNRPVLTLGQTRTEPSVLAVLIDDSGSMRVPDAGPENEPRTRLAAVQAMLAGSQSPLLATLSRRHDVRVYGFDRDARPLATVATPTAAAQPDTAAADKAVGDLHPDGDSTQVIESVLHVLQDLQGQRLAGVVVVTDGRDTPARNVADAIDAVKAFGVKVFPVAVGSDRQPKNLEVVGVEVDDVAFKGDVVNVKATVRGTGYEAGHPAKVRLTDKATHAVLTGVDGQPAEQTVELPADGKPTDVELQWLTAAVGTRDVVVEVVPQPGEVDADDNTRTATVSVLDTKVSVLFVDGAPRWEYRYLKNSMMRDKTMEIACLLSSADGNFLQEGTKSLPSSARSASGHFPDSLAELMEYDVVVLGDVDPRYFSDQQLQLINEFVSRGGGFEMIAGPRFAPQGYRNTPIEPLLPVSIGRVQETDPAEPITRGFRPLITKAGEATGVFRFFPDKARNDAYVKDELPLVFWYCRGVTAKPSVGEVLAEHPTDVGPDGHRVPLVVAGRYGGRTLFAGFDESWRWRLYTGESAFDGYWVKQFRYLARNRKVGQRRLTFTTDQPVYEVGGQVRLTLRVIDPSLLKQLPEQIRIDVKDAAGQLVRTETLTRQDVAGTAAGGGDTYVGGFTADRVGKYTAQLPPIAGGLDALDLPISVILPRLELVDPRVDRVSLSRLASETLGKSIDLSAAADELPRIPSAAKVLPIVSGRPLWDAPLSMALFVGLVATEWVVRKLYGMV